MQAAQLNRGALGGPLVRLALYFLAFAGILALAIRFLARYGADPDSDNSISDFKFLAHDSTPAAYERQAKEMEEEMDDELPAQPSEQVQARPTEPRESHPETHTGG